MKNLFQFSAVVLAGAALLSGCAVYAPTVPGTPLLRATGDSEITLALRGVNALELAGACSPAPGLLVTLDGALQTSKRTETSTSGTSEYRNVHQQGNVGLGTYRLLGADKSIYLGVLGGLGFASASIHDVSSSTYLPLFGPDVHYEVDYTRYYGQLYLAEIGETTSYGFSVRGTLANYYHLKRDDKEFASPSQFFVEPTIFLRIGRGVVQGEGTLGVSMPVRGGTEEMYHSNLAPTTLLVSLGMVFRPSMLGQKK